MISAEFPEINPEPFSFPCASYDEDFVNENCRSPYNSRTYSDAPCPKLFSETNHHSLLLQELPVERDHRLLCNSQERESSGRSSYSCEHIKILMDEPAMQLDTSELDTCAASTAHCDPPDNQCTVPLGGDHLMGGVTVQVECADESNAAVINKTTNIENLAQNLLAAECIEFAAPSLNEDFEQSGSPTPTPSYADRLTTPTVEYPGEEGTAACGVRGGEVAQIEELRTNINTTRIHDCEVEQKQSRPNQVVGDAEELSLSRRRMTPYRDTSPIHLFAPLTTPRRRSGSTLLQHVPVAHHMLHIPPLEMRKLSDSTVCTRREKIQKTASNLQKQRCLSDSSTPNCSFQQYEDEERESSAHGCDSGFQDDKGSRFPESTSTHFSSPRMSLQSLDLLSQDGSEVNSRVRRNTPLPQSNQDGSQSDDTSGIYQSSNSGNPGTLVHPRDRSRRSLMKHFSQGSISGVSVGTSSIGASSESPSLSSLLDCQSNITGVTDLLSSLGFDDFDNPQLVPDRFIPRDLDYLRPSSMKLALTEQIMFTDPPRTPDSLGSEPSSNVPKLTKGSTSAEPSELPLGATAENFLDYQPRPSSPVTPVSSSNVLPIEEEPLSPINQLEGTPLFTDTTAIMELTTRSRILETVPEETASDLSPSPRWFSPRVSIDHSVHLDYADGKLGTTLNVQKVRKRSLPNNREGYRWSIGSLVESDTGDSIHLSVTSYDDMIAAEREKERENYPPVGCEDNILGLARRRRIGVYNPPQTLLSWLSTQKTIDEEVDTDPEELPWPFNEQAHLRKSLTEMSLAQKLAVCEYPLEAGTDDPCGQVTPVSCSGSSRDDSISLSPIGSPNARCSPQPDVSDDYDEDNETEEESDHHMDKASPSDVTSMMLFLGQDSSTNSSTPSLLQTERGSLVTLSLDPCQESGATQLPPRSACGDIPPETSFSSSSRLQELPTGDAIADTDIMKEEDCKNSPPQLPQTTLLPRHSCCVLGASEDPTTITALEERDTATSPSESDVLHRKCSLDISPASEAKDPSFIHASRQQRFAEHQSKSLDGKLLPSAPMGRVRRKAMCGDTPTFQSPVTDRFGLNSSRGKFSKEFKEAEKYMIL